MQFTAEYELTNGGGEGLDIVGRGYGNSGINGDLFELDKNEYDYETNQEVLLRMCLTQVYTYLSYLFAF